MAIQYTPKFNLAVVPKNDTETTFKDWRVQLDAPENSNMTKIEKAIEDSMVGTEKNPKVVSKDELDKTWQPGYYLCEFDPWEENNNGTDQYLVKVVDRYDWNDCKNIYQIVEDTDGNEMYRLMEDNNDDCDDYKDLCTTKSWGQWHQVYAETIGTLSHPWDVPEEQLNNVWLPGWYRCHFYNTMFDFVDDATGIVQTLNLKDGDSHPIIAQLLFLQTNAFYATFEDTNPIEIYVRATGTTQGEESDLSFGEILEKHPFGEWRMWDYVTHSMLQLASTRAATVVVGTSTSGHTLTDCDYLCDGTADDVEIQKAIDKAAGHSGGKVLILEGTYNLSKTVNIAGSNITIEGMGSGTQIEAASDNGRSTFFQIPDTTYNCTISNLWIRDDSYMVQSPCIRDKGFDTLIERVHIDNTPGGIFISGTGCQVRDCVIDCAQKKGSTAISVINGYDAHIQGCNLTRVSSSDVSDSSNTGIIDLNTGHNIVVTDNIIYAETDMKATNAISIWNGCTDCIVCNNNISFGNIYKEDSPSGLVEANNIVSTK